jgi:hypothetical protein
VSSSSAAVRIGYRAIPLGEDARQGIEGIAPARGEGIARGVSRDTSLAAPMLRSTAHSRCEQPWQPEQPPGEQPWQPGLLAMQPWRPARAAWAAFYRRHAMRRNTPLVCVRMALDVADTRHEGGHHLGVADTHKGCIKGFDDPCKHKGPSRAVRNGGTARWGAGARGHSTAN